MHPTRALAVLVLLVCAGSAGAQAPGGRQVPRYQPYTPTTSPYLNLLRPEGAIPNYFSLVRPQQRQQQFNRQVQQFARQQLLENERIEQRFAQPVTPVTGTAAGFQTIGAGAGYQSYSHYFPQPATPRRGR